jgi:hypothetical protein
MSKQKGLLIMAIPVRVRQRLVANLSKFQKLLKKAQVQDINESDTSTLVVDILSYLLGYDKYSEVTTEYAIRGTYCDLAIKINDKAKLLIEVKAIGIDLKDQFVKQAVDYAANLGLEWVVLTNGARWLVYHMVFSKPIDKELIADIDFLNLSAKHQGDLDTLYILTKEGLTSSALMSFYETQQAVNKFTISAVIQSEPVVSTIRRELRRLADGIVMPGIDEIERLLVTEVLKREVIDEEKAIEAKKRVNRSLAKRKRAKDSPDRQS